jgi:hypothetical protein
MHWETFMPPQAMRWHWVAHEARQSGPKTERGVVIAGDGKLVDGGGGMVMGGGFAGLA